MTTTATNPAPSGAHAHGEPGATTRAARRLSWDPDDFPMPTGREEEWKFAPLERIGSLLDPSIEATPARLTIGALPRGVTVTEVTREEARTLAVRPPADRVGVLAARCSGRNARLTVGAGERVTRPVEIVAEPGGAHSRRTGLIEAGPNSASTVAMTYRGLSEGSDFISVDVADGAEFDFVYIVEEERNARHALDLAVRLGAKARFRGVFVAVGGDFLRLNVSVEFAGEGAEADLFGVYYADDGRYIENRVFVDHAAPHCRSRVTYKGAVSGESSRTAWVGDVLIRGDAVGTDTYELNRNLLLTDGARADSVPNLEIETGEIAGAGHASATGRFDDDQLFYLCSRGIPEPEARRMVLRGFFADILREIGIAHVENGLIRAIEKRLGVADE